jgi:5-methyltetrahydrofolate--homocysteine methyltransferase
MARKRITDAVKSGRILISDGAWGTFLVQKGLKPGACPELWCLDRFEDVVDVAKSYIGAGSDMVQTNSFGGSRYKLEYYKLDARTAEINEAAAKASRLAAGDCWVIASIGPTGKMLITEEVSEEELYDAFKEQATALEKGGADAICIETMSDIDEAVQAIKAAKESTACEIICTFTFERTLKGDYRTMMGVTPAQAANAAAEAGADIIGTNCGNGMERMIDIVKEMRAAEPGLPILVHSNAGLPINQDGVDVFPDTPERMAELTPALIEAGANIIGGCCGTTPEHIRAIKRAASDFAKARPAR